MTDVACCGFRCGPTRPPSREFVRIVSWNIERGLQFVKILDFLRDVEADLLLLQEVDLNARRTHYRDVASELAQALSLNYVFGLEFQELGEGTRARPAYHGIATFSPWPLSSPRVMRFHDQSTFWKPRWYVPRLPAFQRRIGGRIALVAEAAIYGRRIVTCNVHLESKGGDELRFRQLNEVLADYRSSVDKPGLVLAGDFNLNAAGGDAGKSLREAGLCDAVGLRGHPTSIAHGLSPHRAPIDWIFISDMPNCQGRVHDETRASDHYPISATLARSSIASW